ncbi:MAG: light-harvesting antenna LH1, alpha subunit [Parvularculaceae bacterium]
MWRLWMLFDPRRAIIGLFIFLFTLAIIIHFVLLSSSRYNWLQSAPAAAASLELGEDVGRIV